MVIYRFDKDQDQIRSLHKTTFEELGIYERSDIQRLVRNQIEILSEDLLVIAEEFASWDNSKRSIDLLCIDKQANLVVVELKRTEDGGHMELQAIRYSAMISAMTFDQAVDAHHSFLQRIDSTENAEQRILDFLGWNEPDESPFAQDVRIVLASADFSKELTSTVLWLNDKGVDIRCVKMEPYRDEEKIYLDMQQVIPLPEAAEFQIQVRRKKQKEQAKKEKFTLTVEGGEILTGLGKGKLMLEIVKALIAKKISPEDIQQRLKGTKSSLFTDFEGNLSGSDFETELKKADRPGTRSKVTRCFCEEEELFRIENEDQTYRTYALTKDWAKETTSAAKILCSEYKITKFEKE